MNIQEIQKALPHRYPFLLVDRVVEMTEDSIIGLKNVSQGEPFFQGHFPGMPVMPGVLIIEALVQAGALLAGSQSNFDPEKQIIYFMGIDKARFRKPVVPGDQLMLHVVPTRKGGKIWKMRGEAKVGGVTVTEADFLATIAPREG